MNTFTIQDVYILMASAFVVGAVIAAGVNMYFTKPNYQPYPAPIRGEGGKFVRADGTYKHRPKPAKSQLELGQ